MQTLCDFSLGLAGCGCTGWDRYPQQAANPIHVTKTLFENEKPLEKEKKQLIHRGNNYTGGKKIS